MKIVAFVVTVLFLAQLTVTFVWAKGRVAPPPKKVESKGQPLLLDPGRYCHTGYYSGRGDRPLNRVIYRCARGQRQYQ